MNFKRITAVMIAAIVFAAGCGAREKEDVAEEIKPIPIEITRIKPQTIVKELAYAGKINAAQTVNISAKIAGKVEHTYYEVGDAVEAGAVLFKLDAKDINDQIRQLESQLNVADQSINTAQNSLVSATGGQYASQVLQLETAIENAKKQVEASEITLANAEIAFENAKNALDNAQEKFNVTSVLYEAGSVPKNDFDRDELALKSAQASVDTARNGLESARLANEQAVFAHTQAVENYNIATETTIEDTLRSAQLGVNQAQASRESISTQLQVTKSNMNELEVKTPIKGVISAKTAKAGEFTSAQVAAYTVVDMEKVNVEVKVSEALINLLNIDDLVDVYINTVSPDPIKGKIVVISPAADQTNTFPVKVEIDNQDGIIKPGMFAEVRFIKERAENTVVLPRNTVLEDETTRYVYVNDNESARKVIVETGIDNGREIEILSGIAADDEVVTKGQTYLSDGDKLNIIAPALQEGGK